MASFLCSSFEPNREKSDVAEIHYNRTGEVHEFGYCKVQIIESPIQNEMKGLVGIKGTHMHQYSSHLDPSCHKAIIETLEQRIALSANLPVGTNLIQNGEFEEFEGNGDSGLFAPEEVVAWSNSADQRISLYNFRGAPGRGLVLQLDGSLNQDTISQEVQTNEGQLYVLSLDLREGPISGETNQFEISFGGEVLDVISPINRWQTRSFIVRGGAGESTNLSFTEVSGASDRFGAFIDRVMLVPVEEVDVTNSSFEETNSEEASYFKGKDLAGWNSVGDNRVKNINVLKSGGSDQEHFLNVDGSPDVLDRIFQSIGTEAGKEYFISFDIRSPDGQVNSENELRVRWNQEHAGTFFGGSDWQNVGFYGSADSDLTRLVFREAGQDESGFGNGEGPFIDNLRVLKVLPGNASLQVNLTNETPAEFIENNGAVEVLNGSLNIFNTVDDHLTGAVVQIANRLNGQNEVLSADPGETGIKSNFDPLTGRLRLSGMKSIDKYLEVLETVTYANTSENPDATPRKIRLSIDSGKSFSESVFRLVNLTPVNDRPIITHIVDQTISVLTPFAFQTTAFDVEGDELTYSITATGTALGNGDSSPTISDSGQISWVPHQSGSLNVKVNVKDPEGLIGSRTFTIEAVIDQDLPEDFQPFSGSRQLSNVEPTQRDGIYDSAPENLLDLNKEYRAIFQTDDGEIELLLYDNEAPVTVTSFVNLARDGYYDGLEFFRVESLTRSATEGFIAQGGDPRNLGSGGPGYQFSDENLANSIFDKPVIAMANQGRGTSTNGSQFFLNFDDNVGHLNQRHTVFGEVVGGFEALQQINKHPSTVNPAEVIRKVTILEV